MSDQCIIHGCTNRKNQGIFIGDICLPCSNMLVSGDPKFGVTFVHKMRDRTEELETELKDSRMWYISALSEAQMAHERNAELESLIKDFFTLLDKTEETDDGRVFRPNRITSSRALDAERLDQLLSNLKQSVGIDN